MASGDRYRAVHARSLKEPEGFWAEQAEAIDWTKRWDKVLDPSRAPFYRWYAGGELNACYNALDRHVERGRADQTALIYDSPVTNSKKSFTYRELRDHVARLAGAIAAQGVGKGDRVIIYMPMIPEAVMAMLACARLGAVHSVVFGGFAAKELASRIDDCQPKLVLTASCGVEPARVVNYKPMLDEAIEQARHKVTRVIVFQRPQAPASMVPGRDLDW
ncbi:MAG TPA: AMP-binding protein, partial [Reyranella sp.]|nr:AMP-binding protein [Reyranella sp.]